ncbi:MAG: hypothetical protein JOZ18_13865, partial [Chloroflexi bacterium]|nr:hypothetical protein [Chloroflexota bacterium]
NVSAPPGQNSLIILWDLQHGGSMHLHYSLTVLAKELLGTIQVSIPLATGDPFCPVTELPFLGPPTSPHILQCTIAHSSWGFGYLLLLVVALTLTSRAVYRRWRQVRRRDEQQAHSEERRNLALCTTRLALLLSALLALVLYTFSAAPIDWPGVHARYLIGLLIATPAIFWPLWRGITAPVPWQTVLVRRISCVLLLAYLGTMMLLGTAFTLGDIPGAQAANQRQQALIDHLIQIGATHIYTDYWTCNRIAFVSQERIICGVINGDMQPSHNRTPGYYDIVSADPHAAYVFTSNGQIPAVVRKVTQAGTPYQRYDFDGYIIFLSKS